MHARSKPLRSTLAITAAMLGMAACNYVLGLQNFTDEATTGGHCDPSTCPAPDGPCQTSACVDDHCATTSIPAGQPAPGAPQDDCRKTLCAEDGGTTPQLEAQGTPCTRDGGAGVCDGQGACVACNLSKDCASGVCSADHTCVDCNGAADCDSGICMTNKCVAASCTDMMKNGDETDVDCGGSCGTCADGKTCQKPTDCTGGTCTATNQCCTPTTCAALGLTCGSAPDGCGGMLDCNDGMRNGTETDVDCGGTGDPDAGMLACPTCKNGDKCVGDSDCTSTLCNSTSHVCCDMDCVGICYGCDLPGTAGQCLPVPKLQTTKGCNMGNACDGNGLCKFGTGHGCTLPSDCASGACSGSHCQ